MIINDYDFIIICNVFERNNSKLANNTDAIREEIQRFECDIEEAFTKWEASLDQEDEYRPAISILGQGRNFLARYIGLPQIDFFANHDLGKQEKIPDPITSKYVAVYSRQKILAAAIKNALSLDAALRFQIYTDMGSLIDAVIAGKVCGIIGIETDSQAQIESHLRHDLKNMSGWNYERAERYVLPPCTQFVPPHHLSQIKITIGHMQEGKFRIESEQFSLSEALPTLLSHMRVPSREICIGVIDDQPEEIVGIEQVLASWPNLITVSAIYPDMFDGYCDIILMDEGLGDDETGTELVKKLRQQGFEETFFVSTSGGGQPAWSQHHFGAKSMIVKNYDSALGFVRFINQLIAIIE